MSDLITAGCRGNAGNSLHPEINGVIEPEPTLEPEPTFKITP